MVEKKNRTPKVPVTKVWKPEQRCFEFPRDKTRPTNVGRATTSEDLAKRNASVQASVNKELHRIGASVRIQGLFLTQSGKYRGSTTPTSNADQLLDHRDAAIRAARTVDPSVAGLEARPSWWWMKIHGVPVARFVGRGPNGLTALREELEAENGGLSVPSPVRWLSGATSVKTRYREGVISASSVILAVRDEDTFRRVRKSGLRLQGRRLEAEAYEEIRPDVRCDHCCEWGHIESKCERTSARCGWCAEGHKTTDHRCPVEGCEVKKGHWCRHTVAKCANCKGPHFAQANVCPKKKAARGEAKGWRSPSPKWRQRVEGTQQPEEPLTEAERGPEGEAEVVTEAGQAPEGEAMEE